MTIHSCDSTLVRQKKVDESGATSPKGLPASPVVEVPLGKLDFENTELEFRLSPNLRELVAELEKNGQQFPVILRQVETKKSYQIISGFRRCRAARELGWTSIKAIIRGDLDDDLAFQVSFIENEKRKQLTILDKANAVAKLLLKGKTPEEIQLLFDVGERQFYRYKNIADFPPQLVDAINDRFIQVTHGLILMEAYRKDRRNIILDEWIDWIILEKASVRQLKTQLKKRLECSARQRKSHLIKTSDGGFTMRSMIFHPMKTDKETCQKMVQACREALLVLESNSIRKKDKD